MPIPCTVCGGALIPTYPSVDYISGEHFTVHTCSSCGLGQTLPAVPPQDLPRYYGHGYYRRRKFGVDAYINRSRFRHVCRRSEGKRILDVGCGNGALVAKFAAAGWDASGVEIAPPDHFVSEEVRKKIWVGDVRGAPFMPRAFDVVTFFHVLEHLTEPRTSLEKAHELLDDGGLLVIEIPNLDSLQARMTKGVWFNLDVPRHVFHFTPRALLRLLADTGFTIEHIVHYSPIHSEYGFLQSILNLTTRRKNILFDALNGNIALRDHGRDIILTALILIPAALITVPLTLFESLVRRGGTIRAYARPSRA